MFCFNRAIGRVLTVLFLLIIIYALIVTFRELKLASGSFIPLYYNFHHNLSYNDAWLIDLPNFQYLMNSSKCFPHQIHILAIVHSAPRHRELRDAIRQSWGGNETAGLLLITVVFLLGIVEDTTLQKALESENLLNGDLVQGNFVDSYRNLTYKHIMGLKWATTYCPQAEILLKLDDDIFVNLFWLKVLIPKLVTSNFINCFVFKNSQVIRERNSKWYVPPEEYIYDRYPDYCLGWAYLTEISVARKLVKVSQKFPYFWIDDVHVTGTLSREARVILKPINQWITREEMALAKWESTNKRLIWKYIFGWNRGNGSITTSAHQKVLSCQILQCICCFGRQNHSRLREINTENKLKQRVAP